MKRLNLLVSAVLGVAVVFSFVYAIAIEELATPRKIDDVAGNGWDKPQIGTELEIEVLPPGIEKQEGDVPGEGKHKGWQQGKHKGWQKKDISEEQNPEEGNIDVIKSALEGYADEVQDWLNQRPNFGITQEGGVSGYRQEIKNWLDKQPEAPDDIIKEITPGN
jgi:hypothetical protein